MYGHENFYLTLKKELNLWVLRILFGRKEDVRGELLERINGHTDFVTAGINGFQFLQYDVINYVDCEKHSPSKTDVQVSEDN